MTGIRLRPPNQHAAAGTARRQATGATHQVQGASSTLVNPPVFGEPLPGLIPEGFVPGVDTRFHSVSAESARHELVRLPVFFGEVRVDMAVSPDGRELYLLGD